MRASKIVIPIALAISLIFVGFTVYADDAQNFIVRVQQKDDVQLSLTMNEDLSGQSSVLNVPFEGTQTATTFDPEAIGYENFNYDPEDTQLNIPNNLATLSGMQYGAFGESGGAYTYISFSFWLVNNSARAVDVDISMDFDGISFTENELDHHIDDVLRVMVIEESALITDGNYSLYAKAEDPAHPWHENANAIPVNYQTTDFASDMCIFNRTGEDGLIGFAAGETKKFTVIIWLEGNDEQCSDEIYGERAKMSMTFTGY